MRKCVDCGSHYDARSEICDCRKMWKEKDHIAKEAVPGGFFPKGFLQPTPMLNPITDGTTKEDVASAGVKFDLGKPSWSLLPFDALEEIVKVLDVGAKKYAAHNWCKGMRWTRLIDSSIRHVCAWALAPFTGSDGKDPETGLSHLAHAGCCILFLLAYEKRKMVSFDDRYKGENNAN